MTNLVLVRHGETVWHTDNRYAGSGDIALTARGVAQARGLADWARGAELEAVWCSPLGRAQQTAAACAEAAGTSLQVDGRLTELDFGAGEGLTSAEMRERFPAARTAFEDDPASHPLPGGEDPVVATERFASCLQEITGAHPDGRVLVVAHSTVIRLALCHLIGVPLARYRRLFPALRNCARTELRMRGSEVALIELNVPTESGREQP